MTISIGSALVAVIRRPVIAVSQAGRLEDHRPKLVSIDRLHHGHPKARRPHARARHPGWDHGDGRHRSPEADVEALKLAEKLAPRCLDRLEVAHNDVGDEGGSCGVDRGRGGHDRARRLEHRSKKVSAELIVVDHQHVNPTKVGRPPAAHILRDLFGKGAYEAALLFPLSVVAVVVPLGIPDLKALVVKSNGFLVRAAEANGHALFPGDLLAAPAAALVDALAMCQLDHAVMGQPAVLEPLPDALPHDVGVHKRSHDPTGTLNAALETALRASQARVFGSDASKLARLDELDEDVPFVLLQDDSVRVLTDSHDLAVDHDFWAERAARTERVSFHITAPPLASMCGQTAA
jgi:hypothetical protein